MSHFVGQDQFSRLYSAAATSMIRPMEPLVLSSIGIASMEIGLKNRWASHNDLPICFHIPRFSRKARLPR